ncbi:MAG TPA: glycosyltransferase family 4 protein [Bacteroidales bacterium]|nr:glycosyltransferase family 4 protein [Bacteroidales bacterium]
MKILLANKYYYSRGGDCIYTIELEGLLKEKGHDVAVFSMQHQYNLRSYFSEYFPKEIDFNGSKMKDKLFAIMRPFGALDVRRKFNKLIKDFKPDIVHLNNIHSQLSPVLAEIAHKRGIPVIWTLHDYKLLCPRYDCLRDNKPCELCFKIKYNAVRYKCLKNNILASFLAYAEAKFWNKNKISNSTDYFICPSEFLLNKMLQGGYNPEKLISLHNFISDKKLAGDAYVNKESFYCYVGRLSNEKGIETLLKAALELPQYDLKIIGTGLLEGELKKKYQRQHIEFMGFKDWDEIKEILKASHFIVIPSEWYENNPLSALESLCLGTPVIGANIGGIPELIHHGTNGLLFKPGDIDDLKSKISYLMEHSEDFNMTDIAEKSRINFNSENYYKKLIHIYSSL